MSHIANSNIRVDNFQYRQQDKTRYVYFLSHCHEDHLRGLSNNWNHGKIYMSYLSKKIIVDRFPGLRDYVVDLEMDEEHWIYVDEDRKEGVQVVLMDAFHCPGAVMFLFKGKMGSVLHTGDFRFSEAMFDNEWLCPVDRRNPRFQAITVDVDYLHLDNTFANPEYDFPSREEAYQGLVNIVRSHLEYRVFLFSYSLGKEEVFLNLAEDFKTKIVVDEQRYHKIKLMDLKPELFTTDTTQSRIHIRSIRDLKAHDINECNREEPTIFIILTGWNDKYNKNLPFYFKVPYSSHSNYRELERFVKAVNPGKLIFNVHERNDTKKRQEFQSYLAREYERKVPPNQTSLVAKSVAGLIPDSDRYRQAAAQNTDYFGTRSLSKNRAPPQIMKSNSIALSMAQKPTGQASSLLHPAIGQLQKQPVHVVQTNIKAGYAGAVREISSRFDVNNREMNKRRFNDQYAHIVQASKHRQQKTKFRLQEVSLQLTPPAQDALQAEQVKQVQGSQAVTKLDLEGQASRNEADLLVLEDSSSEIASRASAGQQVLVNDQQLSQQSNVSKASHTGGKKRKFKELQKAFDGPQKPNCVTSKTFADVKRRKANQPVADNTKQAASGVARKTGVQEAIASQAKASTSMSVPLPTIVRPDASFLANLREQIANHQTKILKKCTTGVALDQK